MILLNEFLNFLKEIDESKLTIILSSMTLLASLISPIVVARISQKSTYKLEISKLRFNEKVSAYKSFWNALSSLSYPPTDEEIGHFHDASSAAMLFADSEARDQISDCCSTVAKFHNNGSDISISIMSRAKAKTLLAMQKDLAKLNK